VCGVVPNTAANGSWNAKGRAGGVFLETGESICISSLIVSLLYEPEE
jgi:hypothetical protein